MKARKYFSSIVLISGLAGAVDASPLRMDYTVTDLGAGSYNYDFSVSLDNHDNSWIAGQGWDWVFFGGGTADQGVSLTDFVGTSGSLSTTGWKFSETSANTPSGTVTNIPTVRDTAFFQSLWTPSAIGDFFTWTGTSTANLAQGDMHYSVIGSTNSFDEVATRHEVELPTASVPEPGSLSLLCAGIAGICFARRSALRKAKASSAA